MTHAAKDNSSETGANRRCVERLVRRDFVMPFGKYKGLALNEISGTDPGYIVWLADEGIFRIEKAFLNPVRQDDMENDEDMRSAMEGWDRD